MRPLVVKLLFHFTCRLLLQLSTELVASLNVRPVFASNELLSVLASLCQTPDAVFALRRSGKRRGERPHLTGGPLERTKHSCTGSSHQLERLNPDSLVANHSGLFMPLTQPPRESHRAPEIATDQQAAFALRPQSLSA